MPAKLLNLEDLSSDSRDKHINHRIPGEAWLPVLEHPCDFPSDIFESVSLNLLKNPNINSSLLFRANVLYDSSNEGLTDFSLSEEEQRTALQDYNIRDGELPGFEITRTIIRRMIPRNPQLDKPIAQTCLYLRSSNGADSPQQTLAIYIPHTLTIEEIPWYHPRVQSFAYLHSWNTSPSAAKAHGTISLHYRLFPSQTLPLAPRLLRTGQHLLSTIHKHGQGSLAGYEKRVHHDQLVSQQRLQDTYTELKGKHAQRLCERWVEKTEPSKHVFEDLGIAAFLIEQWRDMYSQFSSLGEDRLSGRLDSKPVFPGFVDIGCGNGVLVDVLLREGYQGWGFDARRRKTWATFDNSIQKHLKEMILIPQPFFESQLSDDHSLVADASIISKLSSRANAGSPRTPDWHNGIFATGTFIISNHADELTPWTPLLASISSSPFLAIPCCSHNLSGLRFRAPSIFNNNSADRLAPSYFAANVNKAKSIAIAVAYSDNDLMYGSGSEHGDLKDLNAKARAKQPSAYSSLCDWVAHLATKVGYEVEKEMLRLPSTRNVGIVGRVVRPDFGNKSLDQRREIVLKIVAQEKADGVVWVERARGLIAGQGAGH